MAQKTDSYKDRNYQRAKAFYDVLYQVLEDIKYGKSHSAAGASSIHGGASWNKPLEELKGVTIRLVGEGHIALTYHHWEVCAPRELKDAEDKGFTFLKEVVKELKKGFKNYTKKTLTMKEIKNKKNSSIEKGSRVQAENSWMLGSSRYGYGQRAVGRYLMRDTCVYEVSAKLDS